MTQQNSKVVSGLEVWVVLGFSLVLPKPFLLYIEFQGHGPFFILSHVHILILNVQDVEEYTVVYLETKYTIN